MKVFIRAERYFQYRLMQQQHLRLDGDGLSRRQSVESALRAPSRVSAVLGELNVLSLQILDT